eukprot:TRINITY_DN5220_c0_g1_i7.p1 TRINITY_DN5220_c0_g1~~TRINITY_DN5220_c0_g1_i7.p1  ORF type:complete len:201 (-),score=15.59 TRINITY_DN5220_c0_g1_i7:11-613(-)
MISRFLRNRLVLVSSFSRFKPSTSKYVYSTPRNEGDSSESTWEYYKKRTGRVRKNLESGSSTSQETYWFWTAGLSGLVLVVIIYLAQKDFDETKKREEQEALDVARTLDEGEEGDGKEYSLLLNSLLDEKYKVLFQANQEAHNLIFPSYFQIMGYEWYVEGKCQCCTDRCLTSTTKPKNGGTRSQHHDHVFLSIDEYQRK